MIKLNNENLANYVEFKRDKLDNNFTEEELLKIEEVVIDFKVETDSIKNILGDVLKLKNIFMRLKVLISFSIFFYAIG